MSVVSGLGANPFANPLLMPPFGPFVPGMDHLGSNRSDASPAPSSHRPASRSTPISSKSPATKDSHLRNKSPASIGSRGTNNQVRTPESRAESRGTPTWVKSPGSRGTPNTIKSMDCPSSHSSTPAKDSSRRSRDSSTTSRLATPADKLSSSKDRHSNAPSGGEHVKRSKHSADESDRRLVDSKQSVADYYLRNPLLSAEAAAAQSAMFFPFAMPSPFSSQGLLTSPFAGSSLFPYMPAAAAASALGSVYPPSLFGADNMFTNKTDLTPSDHSKGSVCNKSSSSKTATTSSSAGVDSMSSRHRRSPHHGSRNQQDTDWRDVGGGLKTDNSSHSSVVKRDDGRSLTSSHRELEKRHRLADTQTSTRKVC